MVVALLSVLSGRAASHHSVSAYDPSREERLSGTITAFEWQNPHTWVQVATPSYPDTSVRFEGMSAAYLGRRGWTRRTLTIGEPVDIVYFPHRDGSPGGMFVRARLPDGTLRVMIDNDGF